MELLFFYIFAGVAIGSAVMVVTNKNILHAALFLILTFFCVSAIYIILRAEFLAAETIFLLLSDFRGNFPLMPEMPSETSGKVGLQTLANLLLTDYLLLFEV